MSNDETPKPPIPPAATPPPTAPPLPGAFVADAFQAADVGPLPVMKRSETSRQAYEYLEQSGLLPKRKMQVYATIFLAGGPITRNELNYRARKTYRDPAQYDKRLAEMQRLGLLIKVGFTRECTVTKRNCELWDVTGRVPPAYARPSAKPPSGTRPKMPARPEPAVLRKGVAAILENVGAGDDADLRAVLDWLSELSEAVNAS